MRVLLDTHALLWWILSDEALTRAARNTISEPANTVLISAASAWEIATKVRLGKLLAAMNLISDFAAEMEREEFELLDISTDDCVRAGLLPGHHRDPFDRLLIAQAQATSIPIVSNETLFDLYGVRRIW